jgi:hypothetical protein
MLDLDRQLLVGGQQRVADHVCLHQRQLAAAGADDDDRRPTTDKALSCV